jgi:uncharacterized protein
VADTVTTLFDKPAARGRVADNLVFFARALRAAGLPVGPASVVEATKAVEAAGIKNRDDFYWTLHAVLVKKHEQSLIFDQVFDLFWRPRGLVEKMLAMLSPVAPPKTAPEPPKAGSSRVRDAMFENKQTPTKVERPEIEVDAKYTVSDRELLQKRDFAQMSAAEIARAKDEIRRLVLPIADVETRRLVAASRARLIDPRRTLRASLKAGGDTIALKYREPRLIAPPIVAIVDISGSMSQYSRVFLHFLHALTENRRRVHTFLFGTRLTNVTRMLRRKDPDEALAECSTGVKDWSGGTRIAEAMKVFNRLWSRRVLGQGAIVLFVSDGLERDEAGEAGADLAHETERLAKSCRRMIWLNPLLRYEGFEAKARGIRAMLPHVDEFRAVHNLDSVADLCRALAKDDQRGGVDTRALLRRAG